MHTSISTAVLCAEAGQWGKPCEEHLGFTDPCQPCHSVCQAEIGCYDAGSAGAATSLPEELGASHPPDRRASPRRRACLAAIRPRNLPRNQNRNSAIHADDPTDDPVPTEEPFAQPKPELVDTCGVRPRPILPGITYMITRRTTQQLFLLRPSRELNACIMYCLAVAQRRSGVQIHCAVFMSNHYHMIVTDPDATLPVFTEEFNKLIGRALNSRHGREENFWNGSVQTSHLRLDSEHDVLKETVYALCNPTKAYLVSRGSEWPGVRLFRHGEYVAKNPPFFFRSEEDGGLPDRLKVRLTPPPIGVHPKVADEVVKTAVAAREKELRQIARATGKKFMGAAAVKAQSVFASPNSRSPESRGSISPRIACLDKARRIELLAELAEFTRNYREKRLSFLAGVTDVLFPPGTYRFVRQFGARCAEV